jgi:HK97 gp10 family phage protein
MSRIVWNDKAFLKKVGVVAEDVAAEGADMVLKDAKRILMSKAKHPTGKLASEIVIKKSKFEGGGYIVIAQPPGGYDDYYAIFVELGTPNKKGLRRGSTEALPYLRPALHKNKRRIHKRFQAAMK